MTVHKQNAAECDYLYKYAKGRQPIKVREKKIRPEVKNIITENHALEILTFKVGYTFGEPVQYVLYGDCDIHDPEKENDTRITAFNELLRADNKISKDKTLGNWIYTCGVGYRLCLPSEENADHPFDTFILDPRTAFVAKLDNYTKKPVICGFHNRGGSQFDIYTVKKHFYISYAVTEDGKVDYDKAPTIEEYPNPMGMLPVIQYKANDQMLGCFEVCLDECNALNSIASNCVDGLEQFIQSFIWFNNCEVNKEGLQELKDVGAISTSSPPGMQANIKILSEALDQQQTSTLKEDIYQSLLTISGTPDRRKSSGGNTGQAILLSEGWVLAESAARDFENIYKLSEREFISLALKICKNTKVTPKELANLTLSDIDIHFTRRQSDNLLVKTQGLMNMLQAGVHPRHAFKICGLFNDPEQAYMDSKPYLAKYLIGEGDGSEIIAAADNVQSTISSELLDAMRKLKENLDNDEQAEKEV
jgi:SPP1 family phage portal protein